MTDSIEAQNEGWLMDTASRLAFGGQPAVGLLRPAEGSSMSEPIEPGSSYVSMKLVDQKLSRRRVFTSRFEPVFYVDVNVPQGEYKPVNHSALIHYLAPELAENVSNVTAAQQGDRPIFGQTPYQGGISAQFNLLSCRSEAILKRLMPVAEAIGSSVSSADDGADGDGVYLGGSDPTMEFIGGAAKAAAGVASRILLPQKLALDVAKATANAFKKMDGEWTPRFEYASSLPELRSGYYVIFSAKSANDDLSDLRFDPERRQLFAGKKLVKSRDYAVIELTQSKRREDVESIPGLGAALTELNRAFAAGDSFERELLQFKRQALVTPHLIEGDKQELINRVEGRMQVWEQTKPQNEGDNESFFNPGQIGNTLRTLNAIWTAAEAAVKPVIERGIEAQRDADGATADRGADTSAPEPVTTHEPVPTHTPRSNRFQTALEFALRWEGGFSDHPDDRGGATNRGVTQRVYDEWLEQRGEDPKSVRDITEGEVHAIYNTGYWLSGRSDALDPNVDWVQFDASVNHGPRGAKRLLQRALNDCGKAVAVDGVVGPKTLAAARETPADALAKAYIEQRRALYHRIVERNESQNVFLRGWLNRVADLETAIGLSINESAPIEPENTAFAEFID